MRQIQHVCGGFFFSDIILDSDVIFKNHAFSFLMTGIKAVKSDCHGKTDCLCQFQGKQIHIIHSLRFIRKEDNPAGIEHIHNVAVVMHRGPETVRHATFITMGKRVPDCTGNCSKAYKSPLALVALKTLPPPVEAP